MHLDVGQHLNKGNRVNSTAQLKLDKKSRIPTNTRSMVLEFHTIKLMTSDLFL